jgi:hypothetical protein
MAKMNVEMWPQSGPPGNDVKGDAWTGADLVNASA